MADKKAYDKQVIKKGKTASFMKEQPLSPAQQKTVGTSIVDGLAKMAGERANRDAAAKRRRP